MVKTKKSKIGIIERRKAKMIYRFKDEDGNVWGRFSANSLAEAVGMFKYSFGRIREKEYESKLFTITKEDGQGWIRRIK